MTETQQRVLRRELWDLLARQGPYVSLYANVGDDMQSAIDRLLEPLDLPDDFATERSTWSALLCESTQPAAARALFAAHPDAGGPMVFESGHPFASEVATCSLLPQLGLLLASAQRTVPHLVVRLDHDELVVTVLGTRSTLPTDADQAVVPWSGEMAVAVERLVDLQSATDAGLVVLVGDAGRLDGLVAAVGAAIPVAEVATIDAGPAAAEAEALRGLLARLDEATSQSLMDRLAGGLQTGNAVQGMAATLQATAAERVWTLLVHEDLEDTRLAYEAIGPTGITFETEPGPGRTAMGRAIDVAIAGALRSDASVRMLDGSVGLPTDGIAAILHPS